MHEQIKSKLRDFYRRHTTLVKSAGIGTVLSLLGFGLLYIGVSHFHFRKVRTNLGLALPMNLLGIYIYKKFVWSDRQTGAREDASRWGMKWAVAGGISQASFIILVGVYGLPYVAVRWGLNLTLGPLSYVVMNLWIFTKRGRSLTGTAKGMWLFGARLLFPRTEKA